MEITYLQAYWRYIHLFTYVYEYNQQINVLYEHLDRKENSQPIGKMYICARDAGKLYYTDLGAEEVLLYYACAYSAIHTLFHCGSTELQNFRCVCRNSI